VNGKKKRKANMKVRDYMNTTILAFYELELLLLSGMAASAWVYGA
jgi:hypothetical protein